jgi:hypothetical protein
MTLSAVIVALGNIGIFPSRAFIPAFLTALFLRFGHHLPFISGSAWLMGVSQVPTWFTSDVALIVMGILAVLEIAATKSSDAREFMHEADHYLKTALAFVTTLGVLSAQDRAAINGIDPALVNAGVTLPSLGISAAVAGLVFQMSSMRNVVMSTLHQADPHDDMHLQRLISWLEDLWSAFGVLLIILFPLLMLAIVALIAGGLFLLQKYLQYREEKSKVPCVKCGHPVYSTALTCSNCRTEVAEPRAVGFLGTSLAERSPFDRTGQAMELVSVKRCPVCATGFEQRAARQSCSTCGHVLMATGEQQDAYVRHIDARLTRTLAISGGLGLIPVIGIIPAIVYFRMTLVRPFRQYLPFGTGLLVKWAVRLLNLILILLQPIPGLGALLVMAMAYTNYCVYRGVYVRSLAAQPQPMPVALPAPPAQRTLA